MTNAEHQLLRALYLHALAPSTANQDAVRAAGAALDTETGRKLNAPRSPAPVDTVVSEVRADLLARSERGIAEYGCTLDRKDLGLGAWMRHIYEELLDGALYAKRTMRELDAAAPSAAAAVILGDGRLHWRVTPSAPFDAAVREAETALADASAAAPVEPPHAATPFLATLTPEPEEAVLGRAAEALAWDGRQPPVHVPFEPGAPHPYGDDAYQMTTDGVARMFPSKDAAQRWLAAMGRAPA